jgi:tetratricopeptide (TPR) repeat protein
MSDKIAKCLDGQCKIWNSGIDMVFGERPPDTAPISEMPRIVISELKRHDNHFHNLDALVKGCNASDPKRYYQLNQGPGSRLFVEHIIQNVNGTHDCSVLFHDYTSSNRFMLSVSMSPEGAIEHFDKAIEMDPADAAAYRARGMNRINLGKNKGAIEDFDKVVEMNQEDYGVYLHRGVAHLKLKDYRDAMEDINKAMELNPDASDPYYCRGRIKEYDGWGDQVYGNPSAAIEDYSRAIELNPNDDLYYFSRGNAKVKLSRYEEAIRDYDKAIELNPKNSSFYIRRGDTKIEIGKHSEAIKDFEHVSASGEFHQDHMAARVGLDRAQTALEGGCGCNAVGNSGIATAADRSLLSLLMTVLFD